MKTIKVMRDGRPATTEELNCAVAGKPLPPLTGSVSKELQLADTLCEKVGRFLFYYTEGTAKEMSDAAEAYTKARRKAQELCKPSPLAAPAGSARAWTNLQIRKWADRHNIQGSMADIRCAFEDAATTPPNAEVRRGGPDATKP